MTPDNQKKTWSKLPDRVWARCDACGHGWKMRRGDAFLCPYCSNLPEEVHLTGNDTFVILENEHPDWSGWR